MAPQWQLFVDTGGTFTDAVAVTPEGNTVRAKVLSSGALRGTVVGRVKEGVFKVATPWQATGDLLKGGAFVLLGEDHAPVAVKGFDPGRALLELEAEPAVEIKANASFEVRTGEEAPLLAARLLTGAPAGARLCPLSMRLGTTLATNALLTQTGAATALFITRGFGDLMEIGTQQRPDLFALNIEKPGAVHQCVVEVDERISADGSVHLPLDTGPLEKEIANLLGRGVKTAAVALLHSDKNPDHENRVAAFLKDAGFEHVSCSSSLAQAIRILPRASTAVVNAYLAPVVEGYLQRIRNTLEGGNLLVMTSAGGLVGTSTVQPKDVLLSGPAGGVVGAARAGRASGFSRVISFDMGGTSTDVARFDGDYDYVFEHSVGHAHLFAPALSIETVAAGGGSICRFDGAGLAVGPESAGAHPGPACYCAGGPLTLTDVNLLLGRLSPDRFGIPVHPAPARTALDAALARLAEHTQEAPAAEEVLEGFLAIANERMADAVRTISIRRGYDPADYTLVAFGGAGGQHACAVAGRLGVSSVIVPADAGLLSAWGMGSALVERFAEEQVLAALDEVENSVPARLDRLAARALDSLAAEGVPREEAVLRRSMAHMRFAGQETTLQVEVEKGLSLIDSFFDQYLSVYGHKPEDRRVELVSLRVVASSRPELKTDAPETPAPHPAEPVGSQKSWFQGKWREVPVFLRDRLEAGATLVGPALVFEDHCATVVEPGWSLQVDGAGSLRICALARSSPEGDSEAPRPQGGASVKKISGTAPKPPGFALRATTRSPVAIPPRPSPRGILAKASESHRPEAVLVELFSHRFETVAREMGEALRRTAVSTNVKERLDFSCALLDASGELVVNAPHIPVHLGSLGLCVRSVTQVLPLGPGDMILTNHPSFGGSHLPDLTVIAPVFCGKENLLGYVAARAHHAEIGGALPGSMPPSATHLVEEGVVIPPMHIVEGGEARWDRVARCLGEAPLPSRAVEDNLSDLKAAVAACHKGAESLRHMAKQHGREKVAHYMEALKNRAERRMGQALAALPDGCYEAEEILDDGAVIKAAITIRGEEAVFDFTGSAGVHPGNLNATPAIVRSVVIYVLRLLVQEGLPLNEGLMRPVEIILPEGMLNPPFPVDPAEAPSIVGGNVETSQRLVNCLIKALRLCASSQGTMNNVLFGDNRFSYYETVCGGCGAGDGFAGAHAVHSHMTNTRITDPEVMEHNFPVRLERFAVRRGSGGAGLFPGGDGVVREITFLAPLELSVLSQHRTAGPEGLQGGGAGKPGAQRLVRANGEVRRLEAVDSCQVEPGDRLILETPGGGGFGAADEKTGK